ncbi:FAS1 domain-containing protein [Zopfia rhizophila CBS 207.26]|uniref:FAS1 domain-containing protein n=1 Tax=Zopfia rhizophila CBS 207.26 TaxID=1314779 RepID=A0A6A6DYQ3_9PEZI|nr:FAS1 domain-containing protein [Zopfia rhizophila CBS 207.26]
MKPSIVAPFYILTFPVVIQAVTLIEALNQNGASNFAKQIQANPDILALYTSPSVQTVYAVPDTSFVFTNTTLRARQDDPQQLQLQTSTELNKLQTLSKVPGGVSNSNLKSPKLKKPQAVVSESGGNESPQRRQSGNSTIPSAPVRIASGLGKKVNLVRGDVAYDGGVIHIIDQFFTVPDSLSNTISSTGLSGFQSLLTQANLSDTFTNQNSITIFTPSNEAVAAAANTNSTSELQTLLKNHVIPEFTGYLPLLTDGATFTTLAGFTLTISVKNGAYFVNNVKIIGANSITDNGVAHVIDGILTPTPEPFTGAGWQLRPSYAAMAAVIAAVVGQLAVSL